ncbi:unnamed protein product [Phyllotreta striolata]|uniref:Major facilitator superfamily (MFS) profile domain-containing protein n=1 Tax=Phyllotreta striolata TaxID=444603 RepID=A0A9N9TXT3_PHYSR|nr:unnamed protein product [Phyllotreta striolata]
MKVSARSPNGEKEKQWPQILAIVLGSIILILSGVLFAWPSPFIPKIKQDLNYNITESQASWFTVIQPLGLCVASPFVASLPNIIGRKTSMLLVTLPLTTSLLIKAFATNLWLLYFSRLISGAGDALIFAALPAYIGEVSVPSVRGIWGNALIIFLFLGQFLVNAVGSYCSIRLTSFIFLSVPLVYCSTFAFMPESPYFHVLRGKHEEAKRSLRMLRRKLDVDSEFEAIKYAVEKQAEEAGSWWDLVRVRVNRMALRAGLLLRISQSFSGIYAFASYTQLIFEKAGGSIEPRTSAMLQSGLTMFMYSCSSYGSNMLGRRRSFMLSVLFGAVVLFAEATYFLVDERADLDFMNWFPLAGMLLFVVVSSPGIGILPTLMTTELFATSVKTKAVCVVSMVFSLMNIIVNYSFYYLDVAVGGLYGPFYLFACCNVISLILSYYVLPETKGKTLEEIQEDLRKM